MKTRIILFSAFAVSSAAYSHIDFNTKNLKAASDISTERPTQSSNSSEGIIPNVGTQI